VDPQSALRVIRVAAVAMLVLAPAGRVAAQAKEQFIPANFSADGPYARVSTAIAAGMLDYLRMLNARDGGINGVRFTWEKCDTGYNGARGIECYERAKAHRPSATLLHTLSTAIAYSLVDRASADKIPLLSIGYGRPDAADGRVFPYVFPLVTTYWDQAAAMVRYIGERSGGTANLRGRRIALLYYDSTFGKEAIPVLTELAGRYGYQLSTISVAAPGDAQGAQWSRIGELAPDWIIVWGTGAMNTTALKGAVRAGFPRSRMVGVSGSSAEEDIAAAGNAANGFVAATFAVPGKSFPVLADIRRFVYEAGGGELASPDGLGSASYNRGLMFGLITAEAVRLAQERFGAGKPITGEQAQWGLEHLRLDAARLEALGARGLMPPVETSCLDHEGSGLARFMRWDGKRWTATTDWMAPLPDDRATVRRMVSESANAYAKGKGITPRRCPEGPGNQGN